MTENSIPKSQIKFDDFSKVDLRVGTILTVSEIEGSDKLLKLDVDFGEFGKRQILSGIKQWYKPQDLENRQIVFVVNIEPRKMMGLESQGMILATDTPDGGISFVVLEKQVPNGSAIR